RQEQGSSRCFVTTPRLDADETVLHQVNSSNRVAAANFVQQFDQGGRIHRQSVDRDWHALLKTDLDLLLAIGGLLRRVGQLPGAGERRVARIFQFPTLMADMPKIAIATMDLLPALCHG